MRYYAGHTETQALTALTSTALTSTGVTGIGAPAAGVNDFSSSAVVRTPCWNSRTASFQETNTRRSAHQPGPFRTTWNQDTYREMSEEPLSSGPVGMGLLNTISGSQSTLR